MSAPSAPVAPLAAERIDTSAIQLDDAMRAARPVPQLSGAGMFSDDDAYAIQRAGIALRRLRGDARVGMKMGLTSRPKMEQMGVHAPI